MRTASVDLALVIYSLTARFPRHERFGVTAQRRRAAVSVASNIAEGHARSSTRDFLRFLAIARGSLAELNTQLVIVAQLAYVDPAATDAARLKADQVARMAKRL